MKPTKNYGLPESLIDAVKNAVSEAKKELTPKQKQLDVDKDGDIEADDLADLRKGKHKKDKIDMKPKMVEEVESVEEGIEDREAQARLVHAIMKGKAPKQKPKTTSNVTNVSGKQYGGSSQAPDSDDEEQPKKSMKGVAKGTFKRRFNTKTYKEEYDYLEERVKTTHENPLVTVHDKDGLHTHANLSTANRIFSTDVKHTDVHKGPVKVKSGGSYGNVKFALSQHHAAAMKEQAPVAPSIGVHRIGVTVSEPDHPAVSKRKETQQKFVRVTAHDKDKAIEQGKKHFAKKGFKVHDAHHAGMIHEEVEQIDEATPTRQQVKQGIGIARDKRYAGGNMTGAVKAMDKVNKGLAQHPAVSKELRKQNEESELPKAVIKKGHEIAKSIIKHRKAKGINPYAVGMAAAKKEAGLD